MEGHAISARLRLDPKFFPDVEPLLGDG